MDELKIRPQEASEASEKPENAAEQKLDDATLEPRAFVEQSGDFKQAEVIHGNFVALMGNTASAAADTSAQALQSRALAATSDSPLENTASAVGDSSDQAPVSEAQPSPAIPEREETVASAQPSIVKGVLKEAPGTGDGKGDGKGDGTGDGTGDDFTWETHEIKVS